MATQTATELELKVLAPTAFSDDDLDSTTNDESAEEEDMDADQDDEDGEGDDADTEDDE